MPVAVTANGGNTPPRNEVTVSSPDGSNITACTLYRTVGGVRTTTRVQPQTGLPSVLVLDYESPWDTAVQYSAAITYAGGASTENPAAPAQTLTPTPAAFWAIHPTTPGLSMALDVADFGFAGVAEHGNVVRSAQATQHPILGSDLPLLTKFGNRKAAATSLTLTTTTLVERGALLSLTNDETPILIRCPAAWGWGWEDGYYAIGDIDEGRRLQYGAEASRTIKVPLQKVASPAGTQAATFGWADLMAAYADWPSVAAAFPSGWGAVQANTPG